MREKKYLKAGEVAKLLAVTPQTVRHYRDSGKLTGIKTPGGQTVYKREEIEELLDIKRDYPKEEVSVHYARSSSGNKIIIENQLEKLKEVCGEPDYTIRDRGSGLSEKRAGLQRLIKLAQEGKITKIRVTQKDRLSRFGIRYLEELFEAYDVKIEYIFEGKERTPQEELLQDFMSLVASFSGKFYRMRGYEEQRRLLKDAEEEIDERERRRNKDSNDRSASEE